MPRQKLISTSNGGRNLPPRALERFQLPPNLGRALLHSKAEAHLFVIQVGKAPEQACGWGARLSGGREVESGKAAWA